MKALARKQSQMTDLAALRRSCLSPQYIMVMVITPKNLKRNKYLQYFVVHNQTHHFHQDNQLFDHIFYDYQNIVHHIQIDRKYKLFLKEYKNIKTKKKKQNKKLKKQQNKAKHRIKSARNDI